MKPQKDIYIRKSCINGKVVWIGRCKSRGAARKAYHKAAQMELERVNRWEETSEQRKRNILRLKEECLADIPITQALNDEQLSAARALMSISREDIACHREFVNHILESRRRREEDNKIRAAMRERENK